MNGPSPHVLVGAGAAALDDEVRGDAVEGEPVVIALPRTRRHAQRRERRFVDEQSQLERAAAGHREAEPRVAEGLDRGSTHRHAGKRPRCGNRRACLPRLKYLRRS